MINDLKSSQGNSWKNVDDTTLAEIVPRNGESIIQSTVSDVEEWSKKNKLHLHPDKCKEMIVDFKKVKHKFTFIRINSKELELVSSAKILGVMVSNILKWIDHVNYIIKKANKRLYFLVLLRRSKVPPDDILKFYCTCMRPVLEYCAPVFHNSLPGYLSDEIERIQKRALSIISPGSLYTDSLKTYNVDSLAEKRQKLCDKLFKSIVSNSDHKLFPLLPPRHNPSYNLRRERIFDCPTVRTNRLHNSYILSMSNK